MGGGERRGTEDEGMGSAVKEAGDSGEAEKRGMRRAAVRRGGAGGGAPPGSPAPCFEDPAGPVLLRAAGTRQSLLAVKMLRNWE